MRLSRKLGRPHDKSFKLAPCRFSQMRILRSAPIRAFGSQTGEAAIQASALREAMSLQFNAGARPVEPQLPLPPSQQEQSPATGPASGSEIDPQATDTGAAIRASSTQPTRDGAGLSDLQSMLLEDDDDDGFDGDNNYGGVDDRDDDNRETDDDSLEDARKRRQPASRQARSTTRFKRGLFDSDALRELDELEACTMFGHLHGFVDPSEQGEVGQDNSATRLGTYGAASPLSVIRFFAACTGGPTALSAENAIKLLDVVAPLRRDGPQQMSDRMAAWATLEPYLQAIDTVANDFPVQALRTRREAVRLRSGGLVLIDPPYVNDSVIGLVSNARQPLVRACASDTALIHVFRPSCACLTVISDLRHSFLRPCVSPAMRSRAFAT